MFLTNCRRRVSLWQYYGLDDLKTWLECKCALAAFCTAELHTGGAQQNTLLHILTVSLSGAWSSSALISMTLNSLRVRKSSWMTGISHCTVARCPLKRLRIICKLLQDRSIGLKRTRSILLWNSDKKPQTVWLATWNPATFHVWKDWVQPMLEFAGLTARNGASNGLGSKSTSARIGTRTYQWCKECMSTWDWSTPPFGQTHLEGTVSFCVVDIHPSY